MSKNHMADVAKMLGVELGEEFDVKYSNYNPYKITNEGLVDCKGEARESVLMKIITEKFEIVKKPWKPKTGEIYYHILLSGDVSSTTFDEENGFDMMKVRLGNCFRTREEAEANVERWLKHITEEPDFSWRIK